MFIICDRSVLSSTLPALVHAHLCDLLGRIIQRRRNILDPRRRNQTIHAAVLARNVGNDVVEVSCILYIDSPVMDAAVELARDETLGMVELLRRLGQSIEAVHVSTSFDQGFCQGETEAASAARHDEDFAIELREMRQSTGQSQESRHPTSNSRNRCCAYAPSGSGNLCAMAEGRSGWDVVEDVEYASRWKAGETNRWAWEDGIVGRATAAKAAKRALWNMVVCLGPLVI